MEAKGHRAIRDAWKTLKNMDGDDVKHARETLKKREQDYRNSIPLRRLLAREARLTGQPGNVKVEENENLVDMDEK